VKVFVATWMWKEGIKQKKFIVKVLVATCCERKASSKKKIYCEGAYGHKAVKGRH
jgi:hypothetical protein